MGNARGGRIGAMVSGFIYGFELILFSGFTYSLFGHFASVGAEGTGHDCIDAMALMTVKMCIRDSSRTCRRSGMR